MQNLSMALAPAPRFLVFDKNVIHHSRELALEYQCSQLEPLSWSKRAIYWGLTGLSLLKVSGLGLTGLWKSFGSILGFKGLTGFVPKRAFFTSVGFWVPVKALCFMLGLQVQVNPMHQFQLRVENTVQNTMNSLTKYKMVSAWNIMKIYGLRVYICSSRPM